jgi:ABC-2 type transport system permease protein
MAYSAALQAKLEYRADFIIGMVTSTMLQFAALSFLLVVFRNAPALGGWHGAQIIFLFGMTAIALGASELFFNHIWFLPSYIVTGDLDRLLTYPVDALSFFLVSRTDLHAVGNLLTGLGLVICALVKLDAPWYVFALVPVWSACGTLIYTSALVIFACISFKFIGPFVHYLSIAHNLLQVTRYPLSIYPGWLRYALLIVVPFGTFHFLPATWMFDGQSLVWGTLAAPVAAALFMLEARWIWTWGLRKYESTGS